MIRVQGRVLYCAIQEKLFTNKDRWTETKQTKTPKHQATCRDSTRIVALPERSISHLRFLFLTGC